MCIRDSFCHQQVAEKPRRPLEIQEYLIDHSDVDTRIHECPVTEPINAVSYTHLYNIRSYNVYKFVQIIIIPNIIPFFYICLLYTSFVVIHVYWFCYRAFVDAGINIGVVDKILLNFQRKMCIRDSSKRTRRRPEG